MTETATLETTLYEAVRLIEEAHRIVVLAHVNPDADAIGSVTGMVGGLRALGKDATAALNDPVPEYARFLSGAAQIQAAVPCDADLYIFQDSADIQRVGDIYLQQVELFSCAPILNIDHHATNPGYGTVNYVDASASSTSEIVLRFLQAMHAPIDGPVATSLLFGIVGDTGSFQNGATTPGSHRAAAELQRLGADVQRVAFELFERKTFAAARLWGLIVSSVQLDAVRHIAVAYLTQTMLAETGARVEDTEGVVEFLRGIEQANMVLLLRETPEGEVRVSMRSRPGIDVAAIASALGGGGHRQAAGCTLPGPLPAAQALLFDVYDRLFGR